MQEQTVEFQSPIDTLVAISRRLSAYEARFERSTEEFFEGFTKGHCDGSIDFVEWANDYRHFLSLKFILEKAWSRVT